MERSCETPPLRSDHPGHLRAHHRAHCGECGDHGLDRHPYHELPLWHRFRTVQGAELHHVGSWWRNRCDRFSLPDHHDHASSERRDEALRHHARFLAVRAYAARHLHGVARRGDRVLDRDDTALRPVGLGVLAHSFKLEQARSRSTSTRSCIRSARSARRALA